MKLQLLSLISFIVTAVGMIGRVGLVNFNVTFSLSLVLSSHPPDEPLCTEWAKDLGLMVQKFNECHDSVLMMIGLSQ